MQLLTKFWRTKLLTLTATIAATVAIWGTLAWDDWTAHRVTAEEELAGALLYLAATSAPTPAPAPEPPAVQVRVIQPVEVRRVYVVTRQVQGAAGEPAAPAAPPPAAALPTPQAAAPVTQPAPRKQPVQQPAPSAPPPAPTPAPALKPAPTPVPSKGS